MSSGTFVSSSIYRRNEDRVRRNHEERKLRNSLMSTGTIVSPIKIERSGGVYPKKSFQTTQTQSVNRQHFNQTMKSIGNATFALSSSSIHQNYAKRTCDDTIRAGGTGVIRPEIMRAAMAHKVALGQISAGTAKAMESNGYTFNGGVYTPSVKQSKINGQTGTNGQSDWLGSERTHQTPHSPTLMKGTYRRSGIQLQNHSVLSQTTQGLKKSAYDSSNDSFWDAVERTGRAPPGNSALNYNDKGFAPQTRHGVDPVQKFTMVSWEGHSDDRKRNRKHVARLRGALPQTNFVRHGRKVPSSLTPQAQHRIQQVAAQAQQRHRENLQKQSLYKKNRT